LIDVDHVSLDRLFRQFEGPEFEEAVAAQFNATPIVAAAVNARLSKAEAEQREREVARELAW
jgi:hypothetical protein